MTKDELEAIKARRSAIAPTPWMHTEPAASCLIVDRDGQSIVELETWSHERRRENADFIENAPADIDALVAEVERLTADNTGLVHALAKIADHYDADEQAGSIARDAIAGGAGYRPA